MTLAEPAFLALLLLIPLLALGAFLAERQRRTAWQKLVAPRLRKKLAAPVSPWARWLSLACGLLALCLLIFCLAQPIAGEKETTSLTKGRNIIIAVDASRSMLTRDVAPDRLNAAKTAVYELLDRFPDDRIGLLAFAGSASLQAPLTIDHNALRETLDQLDETNVPSGGSNLADAVNLATKTFKETGQQTHGLIVISDGELHEGELKDASFDARQAGVFVVTIGIGTREGDFVPDPTETDGRFRDRSGKPVLSRLNPDPLRTLAGDTGGLYLEGFGSDFTEKIDTVISRLDAFEDEGRIQKTPVPRFQWFLVPAMILMIASILFRFLWTPARPRSVTATPATLALVTIALFGSLTDAQAWNNPLEGFLGSRALKKGDNEKALEHFEKAAENANAEDLAKLRFGQGTARYQSGDYATAGDSFAEALLSSDKNLQRDAHSQLANTLFHRAVQKQGQEDADLEEPISYLEDALEHYDSALELDEKHDPSTQNREVTQQMLEQLKQAQQQQQEQEQEQQQESGEGENEDEQDGQPQEQNQSENGENGEQGEEGEPQEGDQGEEEGEENQGQQGDEGEEGNEGDQQQGQQGQEEGDQEGQQGSQGQQNQQGPAPREDETAEEFARRILKENADFQKDALRKRGRQVVPTKDW
ncbi:MAG: VWA domain-containing protein [Roseibacillus sp.]